MEYSSNKSALNRNNFLSRLAEDITWDVVVIGGGASGLGCAVDAASRGYKTLLLEQADFAKGTSSRSTKLVHGGVRYLAQGDVSLVYEALRERGILLKNAPHLVKKQEFIIPCFSFFSKMKFLVGLKMYDWLAGKYSFGPSSYMGRDEVMAALPGLGGKGLTGGIEYFDGQFDDARLSVNLAQTCAEQGGVLLTYMKVNGLLKSESNRISGVSAQDMESGRNYHIRAKSVVNATGVFVDDILQLDTPSKKPLVRPSQGVHLVLDRSFMNGQKALMIPETTDGRVLFAVPWHNYLVVGTTDTPIDHASMEPRALEQEIEFILSTAGQYLSRAPKRTDVLSVFAGLRPLAAPTDKDGKSTKEISRSHKLLVSETGLVTITGGKWTTYRKMAEDTINKVAETAGLAPEKCVTVELPIHGATAGAAFARYSSVYGSDWNHIVKLMEKHPELTERLHADFPYTKAEVVWAVRNEMARTIEDVLARRIRVLFLNAAAAAEMAPAVAEILTTELGRDEQWKNAQLDGFIKLTKRYQLDNKIDEKANVFAN